VEPHQSEASLRELLSRGLGELGLPDSPPQELVSRLLELIELTARWAARMNLTGHREPTSIVRRLVLPALALASALPRLPTIADLGSGAGFPGLPMAILWPGSRFTLVESRERRHHFQRAVGRSLGLANVSSLHGRAERLDCIPHRLVLAQAMTTPGQALVTMVRWAAPGGLLVLPGGSKPPRVSPPAQVEAVGVRSYVLPLEEGVRTLWIGCRRKDP
jgi:16S rRNA (guanine527-N7)-methyltransferase